MPASTISLIGAASEVPGTDVAHSHRRTVGIGAQHDRTEFVGRRELALDQHQRGNLLAGTSRLRADGAGGDLRILRTDGLRHIVRGEIVADQLGGIEPHSERTLGRIERATADAGNAA